MLTTLRGPDPAGWAKQVAECKGLARDTYGRDVQVWTNAMVTIRDTQAEADAYLRAYADEQTDHASVDSFAETIRRENNIPPGSAFDQTIRRGIAVGVGYPAVGTPEAVAGTLTAMSQAGIDGVILTFVDFDDGLDRFGRQVLPGLEVAGLRKARPSFL